MPSSDKVRAIQLLRTRYLMGSLTEEDYESEVRKAEFLAGFYITTFKEYEFASEQDYSGIFSGLEFSGIDYLSHETIFKRLLYIIGGRFSFHHQRVFSQL